MFGVNVIFFSSKEINTFYHGHIKLIKGDSKYKKIVQAAISANRN